MTDIEGAFARHHRIGFQFSGGRDSTAALFLLRPLWARMQVYHLETGDQFPETQRVVDEVAREVDIVRIKSDVHAVRRDFGLASDIVPVDNVDAGRALSGRPVKIISRFECCARTLMLPMHERMLADGITLIVRGQRDDEFHTPVTRSGATDGRVELLFPIQDWTAKQVDVYLRNQGLPVADYYAKGCKQAPECMGCTAWWDEGRSAYLREKHPDAFGRFQTHMRVIRGEIDRQYATLDDKENDHG